MHIDWTYDGCDEHDEPQIERYWEQVQMELEGKLAQLADAPNELRMAVERGESNPEWEIQAALHLPGRTLVAHAAARRPEKAIDRVLHGLAEKIDLLEDAPPLVTQRREGLHGVVPLLESWRSKNRSDAFLSFLSPLVASIRPYVRREIMVRENEGSLSSEEIKASEVLDEVLMLAWEKFNRRESELPLDLWLLKLANEALDRLGKHAADASLDDESPAPLRDAPPFEPEAWVEHVGYPETIEFSEMLSDGPSVQSWDDLDLETKQTHLAEILSTLERTRRQAFVLNAVHGFRAAEIADFQSRPLKDVEEDIAQAGVAVRSQILNEQSPDTEEPFIREEFRNRRRRRH